MILRETFLVLGEIYMNDVVGVVLNLWAVPHWLPAQFCLGGQGLGNRKASMLIYMGIVFPIENAIVFIKI